MATKKAGKTTKSGIPMVTPERAKRNAAETQAYMKKHGIKTQAELDAKLMKK